MARTTAAEVTMWNTPKPRIPNQQELIPSPGRLGGFVLKLLYRPRRHLRHPRSPGSLPSPVLARTTAAEVTMWNTPKPRIPNQQELIPALDLVSNSSHFPDLDPQRYITGQIRRLCIEITIPASPSPSPSSFTMWNTPKPRIPNQQELIPALDLVSNSSHFHSCICYRKPVSLSTSMFSGP
jgi:hypothetical protein